MNSFKILLAEDDLNFGNVLHDYLRLNGFDVVLTSNGKNGLTALNETTFDLCIFDIMMPEMDGFTLAIEGRLRHKNIPFIFLTAKTLKEDIVNGYKLGAIDYINKPFDSEVLLLKIHAILRKDAKDNLFKKEPLKLGNCILYPDIRELSVLGNSLKVSPTELQLLQFFFAHPNKMIQRSDILNDVWKDNNYFTARSMDVYITKIRKYLQADDSLQLMNIHGSGYVLKTT